MSIKRKLVVAVLFIFCMLLYGSDIYSQYKERDTTFYIKFDFVKDGHVMDENLITKFERDGVLRFSKGLETMAEINSFYVDKKKEQRKLGLMELDMLTFTEVKDFVNYMLKHPNKKKVKINLVEITSEWKLMIYYDVRWKRVIYSI